MLFFVYSEVMLQLRLKGQPQMENLFEIGCAWKCMGMGNAELAGLNWKKFWRSEVT